MSNFQAIATVSAALKENLQAAISGVGGTPTVKTERPSDPADKSTPMVYLFLYSVTPNPALRNIDLPSRRPGGSIQARPQAALDLHYLISFYGAENGQVPQLLLGKVTAALHACPVLTRQAIRDAIKNNSGLKGSDLDQATEQIRLTPQPLTIEDLSRLWALFPSVPYALSVAYTASVVLVEGEETPEPVLPVRDYRAYAIPFNRPVILAVQNQSGPLDPILPGSILQINGENLTGELTHIRLSGVEIPAAGIPTRLLLRLDKPPQGDVNPADLRAGVQGIQVAHARRIGEPPVPHTFIESNLAAFVLHPVILPPAAAPRMIIPGVRLDVQLNPPVQAGQQAVVLLNGTLAEFPTAARLETQPDANHPGGLTAMVPALPVGAYLLRVQVDGAESLLEYDPALAAFSGPLAQVCPVVDGGPTYDSAAQEVQFKLVQNALPGQSVQVRLFNHPADAAPAFILPGKAITSVTHSLAAHVPAVPAGNYWVQVVVDGLVSPQPDASGPKVAL